MKYEIPLMFWESEARSIVNTSSVAGVMPIKGQAAYTAAKIGSPSLGNLWLLRFRQVFHRAVNVVCPGIIDTPMHGSEGTK